MPFFICTARSFVKSWWVCVSFFFSYAILYMHWIYCNLIFPRYLMKNIFSSFTGPRHLWNPYAIFIINKYGVI
jgi:hypothetical protein